MKHGQELKTLAHQRQEQFVIARPYLANITFFLDEVGQYNTLLDPGCNILTKPAILIQPGASFALQSRLLITCSKHIRIHSFIAAEDRSTETIGEARNPLALQSCCHHRKLPAPNYGAVIDGPWAQTGSPPYSGCAMKRRMEFVDPTGYGLRMLVAEIRALPIPYSSCGLVGDVDVGSAQDLDFPTSFVCQAAICRPLLIFTLSCCAALRHAGQPHSNIGDANVFDERDIRGPCLALTSSSSLIFAHGEWRPSWVDPGRSGLALSRVLLSTITPSTIIKTASDGHNAFSNMPVVEHPAGIHPLMELSSPNQNQGRKYKSRKERPCDACRRRKVCCIREPGDDACSLCRMQNTSCRYDQGPTPRRRRRRPASAVAAATPSGESDQTPPGPILIPSNTAPLTPSVSQEQASGEWISQYVGLSGDQDPYVLRHSNFNKSNYYKSGDWACLRVRSDGIVPSIFTLVPETHLDARPAHYPPSSLLDAAYPLHHELLSTYFEVVHTSFPLLDPSRFVKGNKIDLPLLGAMYSLSKPYCSAASDLPYQPLHSFVFQALPIEARTPRLDSIEARLLFLQRHTQIHRAPTTPGLYAEIGELVGMCHDAGLNVDPSKWDISAADRSRRKRLWWALYIFDKWAALGLGRPSYIHADDSNVAVLGIEDIPSSTVGKHSLPRTSAHMFVAMAALSQILSAILTTFYTLKAADNMARVTAADVANMKSYFEQQLNDFHARYLVALQNVVDQQIHHGIRSDRRAGTVYLAFYTAEVVLYRALLRCLPPTDPLCQQVRLQSKQVITAISKLLENLQVTRLRAFWWSPISRINFAIAGGFMFSMLLSSITDEDIDYWSKEITRYRRLLDMQSLSFDTTKLAAARISALANVSQGGRPQSAGAGTQHTLKSINRIFHCLSRYQYKDEIAPAGFLCLCRPITASTLGHQAFALPELRIDPRAVGEAYLIVLNLYSLSSYQNAVPRHQVRLLVIAHSPQVICWSADTIS
ncbi:uncharacterized protein MYCFIDRAFT_173052 [Pseudocercospora fijiensis CIRAD86]|uniref:Zn(2)-C6 fungal-type domain-containing protein n=1 Tax=Pseudocercospora fijiensis (strain CIRAD86) TaxID=383855 RepID=M2Z2C7_PSEFD|nr:uncharacterized protein MYCFIDRAFT_173052 [Pseudocercospora fijiensis CIRAD86]EME83990.1 hypothetical protein MYCFIDRAFT_173052 [Pseudocercospora fijiensis CIRAD86]